MVRSAAVKDGRSEGGATDQTELSATPTRTLPVTLEGKGMSIDTRGGQLRRDKYHALGRVTVHAGLGGAVASTLPVVTILGGGSVRVWEGAL